MTIVAVKHEDGNQLFEFDNEDDARAFVEEVECYGYETAVSTTDEE